MFLAIQVYREYSIGLHNVYLDATQEPHGYHLLDLTQSTNDGLRLRTNTFPNDIPPLTVFSYVGDEAFKTKYHTAGAEDSRHEIA